MSQQGSALFRCQGSAPVHSVIPLALQHVLAAFAAIVTPTIIVAAVCGFTPEQEARIIQAALLLSALDTLLQQFPLFGRIGSGLPIIMGAASPSSPRFAQSVSTWASRPCSARRSSAASW